MSATRGGRPRAIAAEAIGRTSSRQGFPPGSLAAGAGSAPDARNRDSRDPPRVTRRMEVPELSHPPSVS
jgi:hypothetical protein